MVPRIRAAAYVTAGEEQRIYATDGLENLIRINLKNSLEQNDNNEGEYVLTGPGHTETFLESIVVRDMIGIAKDESLSYINIDHSEIMMAALAESFLCQRSSFISWNEIAPGLMDKNQVEAAAKNLDLAGNYKIEANKNSYKLTPSELFELEPRLESIYPAAGKKFIKHLGANIQEIDPRLIFTVTQEKDSNNRKFLRFEGAGDLIPFFPPRFQPKYCYLRLIKVTGEEIVPDAFAKYPSIPDHKVEKDFICRIEPEIHEKDADVYVVEPWVKRDKKGRVYDDAKELENFVKAVFSGPNRRNDLEYHDDTIAEILTSQVQSAYIMELGTVSYDHTKKSIFMLRTNPEHFNIELSSRFLITKFQDQPGKWQIEAGYTPRGDVVEDTLAPDLPETRII
ncbi:hypothetical protein GF327_05110 [Candidatus Woesearchaeota archaeon]|nr:hypothetical protein [Candidatus Woesearchaeota archaeon]